MWQNTKNVYHLFVAMLANAWYKFPSGKFKVIGITGTDGKTTTVNLIYHILKESGKQVSMISTVGAIIGGQEFPLGFHVTTPSPLQLQKFISKILTKKEKDNYLVLEVTSHSIHQNRVWGIPFEIAGITNVTHEHLDYHKTYENYLQVKAKLLKRAKTAVINRDDSSYEPLFKILGESSKKIITYGMHKNANVNPQTLSLPSSIWGEYNKYNSLLAASICLKLGISQENISSAIKSFTLPKGRAQIVYQKDFTVMVDFAHTPNAFEKLLSSIKPKVKGKLIHVFGSAGLRDKTKRPLMGSISAKFADTIIITSEDPRSENVLDITSDIKSGITSGQRKKVGIEEISDRQSAINKAIFLAKKGDFVVITGKAHETSMNLGNGEEPWDEFKAVKKALYLKNKK